MNLTLWHVFGFHHCSWTFWISLKENYASSLLAIETRRWMPERRCFLKAFSSEARLLACSSWLPPLPGVWSETGEVDPAAQAEKRPTQGLRKALLRGGKENSLCRFYSVSSVPTSTVLTSPVPALHTVWCVWEQKAVQYFWHTLF